MGYLDNAGLSRVWGRVRSALAGKQDKLTPDESITLEGGSIGVALPTKALTRAEYDALTEEEKQAEAVYLVDEPPWTAVPLSIQEYDTEDGWHVRKWSSGYVEMTLTKEIVSFSFVHWGEGINTATVFPSPLPLPVPLVKKYSETAGFIGGANGVGWLVANLKTSANMLTHCMEYMTARPGNNPGPATVSVTVTGRWK